MKRGAAGLYGGGNNVGAGVYHLRRCAEVRSGPTVKAEIDEGSPRRPQEKIWHGSSTFERVLGQGAAFCELLKGF